MVKLSYKFRLNASFDEVWKYFSNFETIEQYDPCVKSSKLLNKKVEKIGTTYDITTINNGKQSSMTYEITKYSQNIYEKNLRKYTIELVGRNDKIQSVDEITVEQLTDDKDDFQLLFQYKADICFQGIWVLATPFAIGTFNKIAKQAEKGAKLKCLEKWGQNCLEQSVKSSLHQ